MSSLGQLLGPRRLGTEKGINGGFTVLRRRNPGAGALYGLGKPPLAFEELQRPLSLGAPIHPPRRKGEQTCFAESHTAMGGSGEGAGVTGDWNGGSGRGSPAPTSEEAIACQGGVGGPRAQLREAPRNALRALRLSKWALC